MPLWFSTLCALLLTSCGTLVTPGDSCRSASDEQRVLAELMGADWLSIDARAVRDVWRRTLVEDGEGGLMTPDSPVESCWAAFEFDSGGHLAQVTVYRMLTNESASGEYVKEMLRVLEPNTENFGDKSVHRYTWIHKGTKVFLVIKGEQADGEWAVTTSFAKSSQYPEQYVVP